MTAVTKAVSDPQLFGRELGDRANQILQDMHNGVISVDDAIAQLNALPLDVTFNRAAAAAESATSSIDSMVDSLYGSATAFGAEAKAIEDTTIALREHKQAVDDAFVATNYSASLPVITQYTGEAKAAAGVTQDLGRAFIEGATAIDPMTQAISDLNTELTDKGAEGLDRYMGMIVGFTDGIVDSTGKAKKWADNLIAPVGVYSELDNLLANGKITLDQYNAAQQAQIDITNDDARAQAARNQIQAEQAPLIAQQSDAAADYIEKLAGMTCGRTGTRPGLRRPGAIQTHHGHRGYGGGLSRHDGRAKGSVRRNRDQCRCSGPIACRIGARKPRVDQSQHDRSVPAGNQYGYRQ
jgi:hypothetical protein